VLYVDKILDLSQEDDESSRRAFLGLGPAALTSIAVTYPFLTGSTIMASESGKAVMTPVSKDSATSAGEPLVYLSTANPEISSAIMTIPPNTTTEWMIHPVQGFVFVLEGTLTVEYAGGERKVFKAGRGFPQARSKWHRGRNDGDVPMRFLAVFFGARDVPNVLHPPAVK
jgi:quercetin dioxygenase-like cupin family protein